MKLAACQHCACVVDLNVILYHEDPNKPLMYEDKHVWECPMCAVWNSYDGEVVP